jgi:flagellin
MAVRETQVMSHEALSTGELRFNDVGIRSTIPEDDQLSTSLKSASAIAKAAAINDFSHLTNVVADVMDTRRVGATDAQGGRLDVGHELVINGVTFSGIDVGIETNDELMINLNHRRDETGVFATKDASGRIVLTAEDGRNIEVTTRGNAHLITGLRATEGTDVSTGQLRLTSDENTFVSDRDGLGSESKVGLAHGDIIGKSFQKSITKLDISTRKESNRSLEAIDSALEELLAARAYFGGLENRLGATVSRLNLAGQNAYKGKSTIVDADFAAETAALARNQVLRQSYTLMLKQSNQLPNRILELL